MILYKILLDWLMPLRSEKTTLQPNQLSRQSPMWADTLWSPTTRRTREPRLLWPSWDSQSARSSRPPGSSECRSRSWTASTSKSSSPSNTPKPSNSDTESSFTIPWTESSKWLRPISSISLNSKHSNSEDSQKLTKFHILDK